MPNITTNHAITYTNKVFKITVHGVPCFLFVCLFVLFVFFQKGKISKKNRGTWKSGPSWRAWAKARPTAMVVVSLALPKFPIISLSS